LFITAGFAFIYSRSKIKKVVHSEVLFKIAEHRKTGLIATYTDVLNEMSRE
jgi:hypothetical protein